MNWLPTEATFLKDVAEHQMTVHRDDGLYRHLRFQRPGTWAHGFDLTTWPGFLCFSGDMGCYVFSRIPDMFKFFRDDRRVKDQTLAIDPEYWGSKVQAIDRNGPLKEYDRDQFRARIEEWMDEGDWPHEARLAANELVLSRADDGEHEALRAALEFKYEGFEFADFYEVNVREIGGQFLWCCYALAWAIRHYDEAKTNLDGRDTIAEARAIQQDFDS